MRENIKGPDGNNRGFIMEDGNRRTLHDSAGKVLGYYSKATEQTYTVSGKFIGYGDQVMSLLEN
jgi:hypothetical protein